MKVDITQPTTVSKQARNTEVSMQNSSLIDRGDVVMRSKNQKVSNMQM